MTVVAPFAAAMRLLAVSSLLGLALDAAAAQVRTVAHGQRYPRFAIRNATVVDGNGTPARGPADIVVEGNTIAQVVFLDPVAVREGRSRRPAADAEIDATGKFVLPGLINAHGHVQDERGGIPQPLEYELKLWLASGITTVRDVGGDTRKILELRDRSGRGEVASPRIFVYARFGTQPVPRTPEQARERVRELKRMGVDGIKLAGIDRDLMQALLEEARAQGLRVAHHVGVEETTAWDDRSEEH